MNSKTSKANYGKLEKLRKDGTGTNLFSELCRQGCMEKIARMVQYQSPPFPSTPEKRTYVHSCGGKVGVWRTGRTVSAERCLHQLCRAAKEVDRARPSGRLRSGAEQEGQLGRAVSFPFSFCFWNETNGTFGTWDIKDFVLCWKILEAENILYIIIYYNI